RMVGSWHTNLHEYASRRLLHRFAGIREQTRLRVRYGVEHHTLAATMLFYRIPRVVLAPNEEWKTLIECRTEKPTFLMTRGVDTDLFTPAKRTRGDSLVVNIGYVGRLSAEKNVRALAAGHDALRGAGVGNVCFTIVGDGAERDWLQSRMPDADFTGVLRGDRLAEAYANFDLFVFPSETETVGNVVLEAMASGVPVVAMAHGGPKFIAASSTAAMLARTAPELIEFPVRRVRDAGRRRARAAAARAGALERSWARVFDTVYHAYDVAIAGISTGERHPEETLVPVPEKQSA